MLAHRRVAPSVKFAGTHLHTCVKRGTVREVSGARTQQNVPGPGIKPELLDPEVSALIMRPPHLLRMDENGYFLE